MSGEELPAGWVLAPLGQLAEACLGKMLDKSKNRGSLHPYLRNQNVRWGFVDLSDVNEMPFEASEAGRFGLRVGDVLVCEGGEPGRAAVWRSDMPEMRFQKAIHRVRCGEALLPDWVVHSLLREAKLGRLTDLFTGTGIAHLTGVSLSKVQILLPPLPEQRRIVAKLDELRARSQKAREALDEVPALLEKLKQSVLAAAFRGDLTAEWRAAQAPGSVEPASVLLERIRAERRARWEQANPKKTYEEPEPVDTDGLPELPDGWCWAPAEEIVDPSTEIVYGIVQPGPHQADGVRYVRGLDIQEGRILEPQLLRTSRAIAERYKRASLLGGDVLLGIIRATKVAVVPESLAGANITQGTARFRPCSQLLTGFLAGCLESPASQQWLHSRYRGIDMPGLNLKDVRRLPIPLCSLAEQAAVTRIVGAALDRHRESTEIIGVAATFLNSLDQAVLAKAFRGELVPQDPTDEPAEQLLARIQAEATAAGGKASPTRRSRRPE